MSGLYDNETPILYSVAALGIARVQAKLPLPNDIFGRREGTFDFCAQANPQAAPQYQERKKAMVEDAPGQVVAEAPTLMNTKTPMRRRENQAVEACKAVVEEK